jgi:hypothetical protein
VVHTHPGSLRHPSDGDFRGDAAWVGQLRGRAGVFGIGTADATPLAGTTFAHQPRSNVQCLNERCFSWYALAEGERSYRPLAMEMTLGPDLARPLHLLWNTIELQSEPLERLARQQAGFMIEVGKNEEQPALLIRISLAERSRELRLLLQDDLVRYLIVMGDQITEVDPKARPLDRAVYLILAELAGRN